MKTIVKTFPTMKRAESFHNRLYNRYEYVRLVSSPMFDELGKYVWHVKTDAPIKSVLKGS